MIQQQAQDEVSNMGWTSLFPADLFIPSASNGSQKKQNNCKLMETQSFSYLDEEVASPQASFPCHPSLIHRLQILQSRKRRGWSKLLDGGIR